MIWIIGQIILLEVLCFTFDATSIVKNSDKENCVYNDFDGKGMWSFGNDYVRNVINLSVDNSSLSHAHNCKNNFLVLGEGDAFSINGSFGAPGKKFSINFSKAKPKL